MNITQAISGVEAADRVLTAGRIPKGPELTELKRRLGEARGILMWCRANRDAIERAMKEGNAESEHLRALLLKLIPDTYLDKAEFVDDWWCPECQGAINCATNDERCPDCGTYLPDVQPSGEWLKEARRLLVDD